MNLRHSEGHLIHRLCLMVNQIQNKLYRVFSGVRGQETETDRIPCGQENTVHCLHFQFFTIYEGSQISSAHVQQSTHT
jgi:hypothetical protein